MVSINKPEKPARATDLVNKAKHEASTRVTPHHAASSVTSSRHTNTPPPPQADRIRSSSRRPHSHPSCTETVTSSEGGGDVKKRGGGVGKGGGGVARSLNGSPTVSIRSDGTTSSWNRAGSLKTDHEKKKKKSSYSKPKISRPLYIEPINGKEFKNPSPMQATVQTQHLLTTGRRNDVRSDGGGTTVAGRGNGDCVAAMRPESFSAFLEHEVYAHSLLLARQEAAAGRLQGVCEVFERGRALT